VKLFTGYLLTYLLTPCNTVRLEKLTGTQLVKKFPAFYGTQKFITTFTSVRHLSLTLSQLDPVHKPISHFLKINLNIILPSIPGSSNWVFPSGFPTKNLYTHLLSSIRATCPAHLILHDFITQAIFGEQYRSLSSSLCSFLQSPLTSSLLGLNILSNMLLLRSSPSVSDQVSNP